MLCVGNQTSCWTATPTEPFEYALLRKFSAFEWFPDKKPEAGWDESDLDEETRESIRTRSCDAGVRLSVHARWQASPLTPEGYSLLWKDLALAKDLGATLLNIHLVHEQGLDAFLRALLPLIERTAEAGLQLSIENTPNHSPEDFNEFFARLQGQGSEFNSHVGMCLDLGHANLCAATRNDYLAFIDRLGPHVPLIHLHLHENWGDSDSHLPLFTGPAGRNDSGIRGLVARLKERRYSGAAILEQWPHPPELLDQARERLLALWDSNRPPKENKATAHPSHPEPIQTEVTSGGFVTELVAGDRQARSWREKLGVVLGLLADDRRALNEDELAYIAIYLRFLGTGEIACVEDGRHFRPGNHARLASQIRERLAGATNPDNEFLVRRIYPWLPSSAATFQRPEPLTRIRDIAHRNDIDPDLKREIKTTLQNKLHRCAGPEDLATSSALLQRITAPGSHYSEAFVEQFRIFHEELKEFFNAQSLDRRLAALQPLLGSEQNASIERFLADKTGESLSDKLNALRSLTALRRLFSQRAAEKSKSESQDFLLADIALEDFAFVLLSQILNSFEPLEPNAALETESEALLLALENLELSGFDREEAAVLQREIREWRGSSTLGLRDELLRLYATVLRCRRLAETFSERIVDLFSERAEKLGRVLGVAEHAIRVFSEADLRSHIVFQTSKLVSRLLRIIRQELQLPPWDVLVGGRARGRLLSVDSLEAVQSQEVGGRVGKTQSGVDPGPGGAGDAVVGEPVVALLKNAEGDEEIPQNISAIILAHEMPHLSHLSVRARQEGVVFVTCEAPEELNRLRSLEGRAVSVFAMPNAVSFELANGVRKAATKPRRASFQIPRVKMPAEGPWIPLERASGENSGGKASGARRLEELSRSEDTGFQTPQSLVIPFGIMEEALASMPKLGQQYRDLLARLAKMPPGEIPTAARQLRKLVLQVDVPAAVTRAIAARFEPETPLIVRSSCNCEDLEELAGAGLYDSIINVTPAGIASAVRAVWASLWTERATASRQKSGIPHDQAHMAVLIQELVNSDLAFVLHTVNPVSLNTREVYLEIVVGLGETLVSAATRGSPYRLVCDKDSGSVTTLEFGNFSRAARPAPGGGFRREIVDYSQIALSRDLGTRELLGRRLAALGSLVEKALGAPQDIEGSVVKDRVYLVQARPQTGLHKANR